LYTIGYSISRGLTAFLVFWSFPSQKGANVGISLRRIVNLSNNA